MVTQAKHCIVFSVSMTKSQSNFYWNRCIPSFHSLSAFWANGKQNCGLVNFILELFLPFPHCIIINSIYHKMAGNAEDSSVKIERKFLFGTSSAGKQENRTTVPEVLFFVGIFNRNNPKRSALFTFQLNCFTNDNQPKSWFLSFLCHFHWLSIGRKTPLLLKLCLTENRTFAALGSGGPTHGKIVGYSSKNTRDWKRV